MAVRRPLVNVAGTTKELPDADSLVLGVLVVPVAWSTAAGAGPPVLVGTSAGTKAKLYPIGNGVQADFAIGIDANTMWLGVADSSSFFKWYAGINNVATIDGAGNFTVIGDFETNVASKGVILKSPNGTRFRVAVGNDGALTTAAI